MDYSFLRLIKNDFNLAKKVDDIFIDGTKLNPIIKMLPNECFLQHTNCTEDIAFAGNLQADLVDCSNKVILNLDVLVNFFYNEYTNTITGIKQISYEFGNIGIDYGQKQLHLRLSLPSISDDVWWSNGFLITEYGKEKTIKLHYKNENYFNGVCYDLQPYFQSIRLACFKFDRNFTEKKGEYTKYNGNEITLRVIRTIKDKFKFDWCNFFVFDRLLSALSHDELYIDGYRVSNKPTVTKGDRIDTSNFFELDFEANITEDFRADEYEIYQAFNCIAKIPNGSYILANYNTATSTSTLFTLSFNKPFTITSNIEAKLYKNGTLFATFDASKFSISGQSLNIDVSASPITDIDVYTIVIPQNKVNAVIESWGGFAFGGWVFSILAGDYDLTEYDEIDYL